MFCGSKLDPQILDYHSRPQLIMEAQWKPHIEVAPNCPRCASPNTKFCYYNNYSFSQPRYFCKGCKRYWTKGGSLRNVPVGGGCRKSRRSKSTRSGGVSCSRQEPFPDQSKNEVAEIDMAAVFAKYVNQESGSSEEQVTTTTNNDQENSSSGVSSGSSLKSSPITQSQLLDDFLFSSQNQSPLFDHNDQVSGEKNVHDFVELENILGNEQEMLWSDDNISLPNVAWQENPMMVQLEDFGSFSPTECFPEANQVVADNWNLLDFSSYENFQRF